MLDTIHCVWDVIIVLSDGASSDGLGARKKTGHIYVVSASPALAIALVEPILWADWCDYRLRILLCGAIVVYKSGRDPGVDRDMHRVGRP